MLSSTANAILRYVVCYVYDKQSIKWYNIVYGIVYLIATIGYVLSFCLVLYFDIYTPTLIFQTLDYIWFGCLFLSSYLYVDIKDYNLTVDTPSNPTQSV